MTHYKNFEELMKEVLRIRKTHPEWKRLDGKEADGNRTGFASFHYAYLDWQVNSDTKIKKLVDAWKIAETGEKPFVIDTTDAGNRCLRLSEDDVDGLYIYLKE